MMMMTRAMVVTMTTMIMMVVMKVALIMISSRAATRPGCNKDRSSKWPFAKSDAQRLVSCVYECAYGCTEGMQWHQHFTHKRTQHKIGLQGPVGYCASQYKRRTTLGAPATTATCTIATAPTPRLATTTTLAPVPATVTAAWPQAKCNARRATHNARRIMRGACASLCSQNNPLPE